jgi:AraC family transcriptional regulator
MDQNLDENLSLVKLARVAGMSVSHFGRAFKMTLGVTPHCYLLQQRVAKAKILLSAGQLSIAQIALECGFVGQAHFTTIFRKLAGSTPKIYSASIRKAFPRL